MSTSAPSTGPDRVPMPPTKTSTAMARSKVGSKANCGYTEPTNGAYRPPAIPTKNAEAA